MTNTRITDPEILERRFPVVLREFSTRVGSGGFGEHTGGNGLRRVLEFLTPITVSVLSERRVFAPRGTASGLSQIPPPVRSHTRLTLSFIYRKAWRAAATARAGRIFCSGKMRAAAIATTAIAAGEKLTWAARTPCPCSPGTC